MDVTELKNEGLAREFKVVIPAADLQAKLDTRLEELARNARIPGFRPGKVPVAHIRKLYGRQAMAELIDEAIKESMDKLLSERDERPAMQPQVNLVDGEDQEKVNAVIEGKADLAYTMSYEVTPRVEVKDLSGIELTRFKVKVPEEDIDKALEDIARQFRDFSEKPAKARAEKGDRLTISFVGRIDGEEFEGGKADDTPLELGSGQFIPGFEDQLIGARASDEVIVKVTFPEDYGVEKLAGKEAEFTVNVKSIETPGEAKVDDSLAQKLGMKDLEELRQRVREQAGAEFENMSWTQLKRDVLDAIDAQYDFELPKALVDSEFEIIWHSLVHQMEEDGETFESSGTSEEEAREEYRQIAERRVRLGLVLGTIGEQAGVSVSNEEMQQALIERARQFPGQEQQVFDFYKNNPDALMELRGPLFENKTIEHIVEQAKVTEKEVTREEMEKMLAEDDGETPPKPKGKKKAAASKKSSASEKATAKKTDARKTTTKKAATKKSAGKKTAAKKGAAKKSTSGKKD